MKKLPLLLTLIIAVAFTVLSFANTAKPNAQSACPSLTCTPLGPHAGDASWANGAVVRVNYGNITSTDITDQLAAAIVNWNQALAQSSVTVSFEEGSYGSCTTSSPCLTFNTGTNAGAEGQIYRTGLSGSILTDAEIRFDPSVTKQNSSQQTVPSLDETPSIGIYKKVAMHEMGHTLGLNEAIVDECFDTGTCIGQIPASTIMNGICGAADYGGNLPTGVTACDISAVQSQARYQPSPSPEPAKVVFMASADHESVREEKEIGNTNLTITSGVSGAHGRVYNTNNALLYRDLGSSQTSIGARMRFQSVGSVEQAGLITVSNGADTQARIRLNSNGSIQVFRGPGSSSVTSASSSGLVVADTWYWIEAAAFIDNTAGSFRARLWSGNGSTLLADLNVTGADTQYEATSTTNRVYFGYTQSSGTYVDDVSIDTNKSLLGPSRVEVLYPNAAGSFAQFTRTGTDLLVNYLQVNEAVKDTASSVTSSLAQWDSYNFSNRTISGTPLAVQPWAIAVRVTGGADPVLFRLPLLINRIGFEGATHSTTGGTCCQGKGDVWYFNPATGAAWTDADINAMETGIRGLTENVRIHQLVMEVLVKL
jgi:hypothetical protein